MEIIIRYIYADEISNIILLLSFPNIVSNRNQRVIQTIGERLEKLSFLIIENLWIFSKKYHIPPIFYSIIRNKEKYFKLSNNISLYL